MHIYECDGCVWDGLATGDIYGRQRMYAFGFSQAAEPQSSIIYVALHSSDTISSFNIANTISI